MPNPPINFDGDLKEVTVEDFGQAHVRFADGSSMSVEGNWLQHDRSRAHGFDVLGTLGVGKDVEPHIEVWDPETGAVTGVDLPFEEETASRTLAEHTNFLAAIGGADVSLVRFEEAINVQRIIGGIYASAATGAEVRV
jgi:predicted dehydrogenase